MTWWATRGQSWLRRTSLRFFRRRLRVPVATIKAVSGEVLPGLRREWRSKPLDYRVRERDGVPAPHDDVRGLARCEAHRSRGNGAIAKDEGEYQRCNHELVIAVFATAKRGRKGADLRVRRFAGDFRWDGGQPK